MKKLTVKYSIRLDIAIKDYCDGYRHARDSHQPHFDNVPALDIEKIADEFLKAIKVRYGKVTPIALGIASFYRDLAKRRKVVA